MNRLVLFSVFLSLLFACARRTPTSTSVPATLASVAPSSSPANNAVFTIAIEYAILGVAEDYAATGVTYAKPQLVFTVWGNVEPQPGQYVWGPLDALIHEYQAAGFSGLQILLSAESPWAATRQPSLGDLGDTFPKEEYLDDYQVFVARVVERYDADGVDDMSGLLYPIHHYGIEREFTGFWPGEVDEYLRLLRIAYPAIKTADPESDVLLVALLLADVFDGNPSRDEINRRLAQTPGFRKSHSEILAILAACDAYDIVDFHSLGDYTEIPPTAAWIGEQLAANGCGDKPIWIGDAFPMSGLVGFGGFVPPIPFHPATLETRDAVVDLLRAVADPADPDHTTAKAWMYAETARGLVKKIVVSAAEKMAGINIGNLEDWKTGTPALDKSMVPALGASMFMGLMDTTITPQRPGGKLPYLGHMWSQARKTGEPRPGFYALKLVYEKIGGFTAVDILDLGVDIWAYRFETPNGPLWVLWYDDGKLYLPGESLPSVSIQLPFDAARAVVTSTPSEIGQREPDAQVLDISGRMLLLTLDSTPVFIQIAS